MLKQATLLSVLMAVGYATFIDKVPDFNDARELLGQDLVEDDPFRQLNDGLRNLQTTTRITSLSTNSAAP